MAWEIHAVKDLTSVCEGIFMSDIKKEPSQKYEKKDNLANKIKNSPLVSIIVILGIVGILFPLLGWMLEVATPIHSQDLEKLREDLVNIQKVSQDIQKAMERIISTAGPAGDIRAWRLNDYERDILKRLSHGQRSHIATIFSLFLFLIQGTFFVLIGILLERKIIAPRQSLLKKREIESISKDISLKENIVTIKEEISAKDTKDFVFANNLSSTKETEVSKNITGKEIVESVTIDTTNKELLNRDAISKDPIPSIPPTEVISNTNLTHISENPISQNSIENKEPADFKLKDISTLQPSSNSKNPDE